MNKDYPATIVVHWPTGPINCCEHHANQLIALGAIVSYHIAKTKAEDDVQCTNCINESKKNE